MNTRIRKTLILPLALLCGLAGRAQGNFEDSFTEKSLRIDFALSGNKDSQSAAIERLREEPVWGGPRKNLVDTFRYGGYYINVYDAASDSLLYARGFNTLFEEWRTTEQAQTETQSWTNSVAIPYPKAPVRIELTARNRSDMRFHPLLTQTVDPASIFIDRGKLKEADARRFEEALFATPPFDTRRADFNIWAVGTVSEESGTDLSGKGVFKHTALNSGYYTFGIDRYLTTPDMKAVRDAVWNVPCDAIFILVNTDAYGGGGMYNFYAMGTADHPRTPVVFVHELGHSLAGLADEYFSSEVAYQDFYNLKYEPWEPNITTLVDFGSKWEDLLPAGTPIPTPLDEKHREKPGVFEGGGYVAKGIYRPMDHCMMRDYAPFCPACVRAIHRMIDFLTDK